MSETEDHEPEADQDMMNETEDEEDDENAQDKPDFPLIFQCNACHVIVGDTMSWECTLEEIGYFILSRVTDDIEVTDKSQVSNSGFDKGSVYVRMQCRNCKANLGRVYKATPVNLDHLRDMFTFNAQTVNGYQLGSASNTLNVSTSSLTKRVRNLQVLTYDLLRRVKCIESTLEIDSTQLEGENGPAQIHK